jgi:hypothetical protein
MLKQKITDEELEFMECWHTPRCLAESLFSNFDNLSEFHPERFGEVRTYQIPFLSHEPIADENITGLSQKEKFQLRKNAGDAFAFGGRNHGKTAVFHKIDIPLSLLHDDSWECVFTSIDAIHMDRVLDSVKECMENHPIVKCWTRKNGTKKSPWRLVGKNGWRLIGANMGILSSNPGKSFYGLHVKKMFGEEMSLETQAVYEKRQDSVSEFGAIMRLSGMTNFTRHSPAGKAFYNPDNKSKLINLPQYCLAKDTLVLMSDFSQKKIQDVKIGDEIISFTEYMPFKLKKNKVLNKIKVGLKETNQIETEFNKLSLTSDHKVLIKRGFNDIRWKKIKDIDLNKDSLYNLKHCITNYNEFFEGCFLGLLESEGSFGKYDSYSIAQKDECEFLEWLLNKLKISYTKYDDKNHNIWYYYLKTSNRKYIKKLYKKINNYNFQLGFLNGFIAGDGCIHIPKKRKNYLDIRITQKNKTEILDNILKNLKIKYKKYSYKYDNDCWHYKFPKFEIPIYMPNSKKYFKYINNIENSTTKSLNKELITLSKTQNKEMVYDLTTETHTIIANGFVVHNCNPFYDKRVNQQRLEEFGGEDSILFKTFVKGEICEDGVSEFDMERIAKCVNEKIEIKSFEITKDRFKRFKNVIVVERPTNAERIFIAADIGEGAGSELIVISETKGIYTYLYNITLYNLTHIQQTEIFNYLIQKLQANVVAIDCGDGTGRAIYRELEKTYPKENLIWYDGSKNIAIDFEKDNEGNIRLEKGKPIALQEFMSEWSVRRLKSLLYEEKIRLPKDYKFEIQFSSVMGFQTGTRTKYKCLQEKDHLFDSFRVFAIAEWLCASHLKTPKMNTEWGLGAVG